ncbi:DUF6541 family protein [Dermabacter jinjuensis]|uniref:Uncharacterized protein n=1 Tax=Dermabacter jinjuensis TaxID=1667168 RepID=A0ABM6PKA3_9MICO|nr:DUF6541 family protein [Dermabacter jinjuensis]ATH95912.1 hypothetical protein COP05_01495 [Dermabacter jinjuensis]UEB89975.1 hypothetical protein LK448_00230 [Dermabacter jinjuensis]
MTWQPLILPAIVACLWVTVPGFLALSGLRSGWLAKIVFAPLASVGVIGLTAIIGQIVGLSWGPLPMLIATTALCLISWAPGAIKKLKDRQTADSSTVRAQAHLELRQAHRSSETINSQPPFPRKVLDAATSTPVMLAIAAIGYCALILRHLRNILQTPYAFGQKYDNVFHLNAIRWIVDTGRGSSLTLQEITQAPWNSHFYPSAWHDIASLSMISTGTMNPVIGTNAALFATFLVVWPTSILALIWTVLPKQLFRFAILPGGVILASVTAFPFRFIHMGVLFPNFLGYCLVPAMTALFIRFVSTGNHKGITRNFTIATATIGAPGIALSHPTGALTVTLFGLIFLIVETFKSLCRKNLQRTIFYGSSSVLMTVLTAVAWKYVRPPSDAAATWDPISDTNHAMGTIFVHFGDGGLINWAIPALICLGIFASIRRNQYYLLLCWATSAFLYVIVASFPKSDFRTALVGVWYSDPERLYGLMGLTTVPLAIFGIAHVTEALYRKANHLTPRFSKDAFPEASFFVCALAAGISVLSTQATPPMNASIDRIEGEYKLDAQTNLLNAQEMKFIESLPAHLPSGSKIWAQPWRGEGLIYAFTGFPVSTHHLQEYNSDADIYVEKHLNEIDSDPTVCSALRELDTEYVVHFEGPAVDLPYYATPGLKNLDETNKLELVYQNGNAYLYRATGCNF